MKVSAKNALAEKIRQKEALPELLSPAGSFLALEAAIEGGADAVYMGGVAYNARINAKNFTEDELLRGISLAHSYGVKVYIAANTAVYDRELDGFLSAAEFAYNAGADALIVADMGMAKEIHRRIPIELHASTQASGHSSHMSDVLSGIGFSRMVCAREMSYEDISAFIDTSPLEAEVFVHGALCVCHSGQCLFSSLVGGRSGNRGECAQPCRLPYGGGKYPLSLKDLTLAGHIPELCDMGVCSLKIEGRMKSPEYVRDVTSIWRRLLDERRAATHEEIRTLGNIFSRGGFTDGYFTRKINSQMLGVRTDEQKSVTRTLTPFEGIKKKIPLDAHMTVKADMPLALTLTRADGRQTHVVSDTLPMKAITSPISADTVIRSLSKLGSTCYEPRKITVELDGGLMVPVSVLNALRRRAIEQLDAQGKREKADMSLAPVLPKKTRTPMKTAMFFEPSKVPELAYSYFDIIYTPLEKYTGNTNGVAIPPVIFDSERQSVRKMLENAAKAGASHLLVGSYAHLSLAEGLPFALHGDFRLNVTNNSSAALAEQSVLEDTVLLPELTLSQMRDIGGRTLACVYGRIPLMVTEKCVAKEVGTCEACRSGKAVLKDRRGVSFPVLRAFEHRSIVFNSVPIYMADKKSELLRVGLCMQHFIFTTETKEEAQTVINAYKNGTPPSDMSKIKRIR